MKLLLDTHIWVWSLREPRRLSRRVTSLLSKAGTEMWVSPVSSWEVLTLTAKGRVAPKPHARGWIESVWRSAQFQEAPFTQSVALALDQVWLPHRDPADWFLAATARTYGLTLVTADTHLRKGRGFQILFNE